MTIGRQRTARIAGAQEETVPSPGRNSSRPGGRGHFVQAGTAKQTIDWRKVQEARRRLDAGHYDQEDVLETVLDLVLTDFAEPKHVSAMHTAEVEELR